MITAEEGQRLIPGDHVVHTVSEWTGEVFKVMPWGVQVWNPRRAMELENWTWGMVCVRRPRVIRRFPRPWRYPREMPTKVCHCKIGKLKLTKGGGDVRCQRCKFLIGSESFPNRIRRAKKLLLGFAQKQQSKTQASQAVERPKYAPAPHSGKVTNQKKNSSRGVGVRPRRTRKEARSPGKNRARKGRTKSPRTQRHTNKA